MRSGWLSKALRQYWHNWCDVVTLLVPPCRMVLQVVKARHDAYAAAAAATAAAGRASSSGGGAPRVSGDGGSGGGGGGAGASDSNTTDVSGNSVGKAAGAVGQQGPSMPVSLMGRAEGLGAAAEAAAAAAAARPSPPPAASPGAAGLGQAREQVHGAHGHGCQGAAMSGFAGRLGRQWSDAAAAAAEGTGSCPPEGSGGKAQGGAAGQGERGASNSVEAEGAMGVAQGEAGDDMDTGV